MLPQWLLLERWLLEYSHQDQSGLLMDVEGQLQFDPSLSQPLFGYLFCSAQGDEFGANLLGARVRITHQSPQVIQGLLHA